MMVRPERILPGLRSPVLRFAADRRRCAATHDFACGADLSWVNQAHIDSRQKRRGSRFNASITARKGGITSHSRTVTSSMYGARQTGLHRWA